MPVARAGTMGGTDMQGGRWWAAALVVSVIACAGGGAARAELTAERTEGTVRDLPNPPVIRSRNGVLDAVFVAKPGNVTVATDRVTSNVYNDLYIPPTLKVRRGDTMLLRLVNRIGPADVEIQEKQPTNIHFHGMDVSPKQPGDNVFVNISPGRSFQYRVEIPDDHPQGLHWYHSHLHEYVDPQILSGLSGMLIVEGGIASHYPALVGLRQRVMVLKDINLPGDSAPTRTINGLKNPPIRSRPGELQIWAIGNLGADSFFNLRLEGHRFWVLERDGNFLRKPIPQSTLFLPPGARTLVVVEAGAPGSYYLQTQDVDTGPTGLPSPKARLGTFIVAGPPVLSGPDASVLEKQAANIPSIGLTGEELRTMPIAKRRTFTFSDAPDFSAFYINGLTYDENRIDTKVQLGHVEEWTIKNAAGELHVFHLHQTAFLVKEVNGVQQDYPGLRDVINVPWQIGDTPGEVKLIIPFLNPLMVGKFVYHCHIVGHEDAGMMQNIQVLPQRSRMAEAWDMIRELAGNRLPELWAEPGIETASAAPLDRPFDESSICRAPSPRRAAALAAP
jgi:FtsP/CotA-like multicopper oxidase with cupredoxin domain